MNSNAESAIVNARETAKQAANVPRSRTSLSSGTSQLRRGIVSDVNTYTATVDVLGADGSVVDSLAGCLPWGDYTPSVSDKVVIFYEGNRPVPFIMSSGGGGTVQYRSVFYGYLGIVSE